MNATILHETKPSQPVIFCACGMGPLVGREIPGGICFECLKDQVKALVDKAMGR